VTALAAQPAPPAERLAGLLAAAELQGAAGALARRLAQIPPRAWPPAAAAAAWEALANAGAEPDRLGPRPSGHASHQIRALWVEEPHLVLAFGFDEQLHAAVRALPERHYDHRAKRWTIATTPENATALEAIVQAFDIHATPAAAALLAQAAQGQAPRSRRSVERHGDSWRIVLPKPVSALDELLLNDVRDLPDRRYVPAVDDTPAHWLIDTTSSDALTALANFVDVHHATLDIAPEDLAQLNLDRTQATDLAANVTLADKTFDLSFDFDETLLEQVRSISGRVFDPERRVWSLPRSVDSARKLTAILATHQLTVSDDATRELHRLALQADQIVATEDRLFDLSRALDADLQLPDGFGFDLFAFQRAAVLYALTAKRTFLADAQGLGKTIEALAALHAADAFPALVCTKSPMKLSWRDMATCALPGRDIRVLAGREPDPAQLEGADVVICNYDIVSAWAKALSKRKFRALVADDAHVLKEPARMRNGKVDGPRRNYDIKRLADQVRRSDGMILLLTASPVVKRARDLIGQLTIMGQMGAFGGAQAYKEQHCLPGSAPILLADFSERPIREIQAGDVVVGWTDGQDGSRRRLVEAIVREVHRRRAALQRVTLSDGATLVCTPDHRWYVGAKVGSPGRMYQAARTGTIGANNRFVPSRVARLTGRLQRPFESDPAYARGYAFGFIAGDGWASRETRRVDHLLRGKVETRIVRNTVGAGCVDPQPIERLCSAMADVGVGCFRREEVMRTGSTLHRVDLQQRAGMDWLKTEISAVERGSQPQAWWAGFLGGIYDAEGSGAVIFQVKARNPLTWDLICRGLERFDFRYTATRGLDGLRLQGGRAEFMRFWDIAAPTLTRKLKAHIFSAGARFVLDAPHVTEIIPIDGEHDVYTLTTDTGNYVAYGYGSKNCDPKPTGRGTSYDGTTNPQLLNVRLRETCMCRRLKHDVLTDLPAKRRAIVRLELAQGDRTRYDRAKADIVAFLRSEQQRTAQTSLLAGDADAHAAKAPALVRLNKLRQLVAEAKLPAVIDWTHTFLDSGEKLIVFAEHREIQHALVREFRDCARILGGVSADAAHANAQRFQTDPACQLMVCSLQAASHGLTLSAASHVAMAEMAWTAAAHDHAEDRGYGRLDNPHGLTAWYLLADGTLDFDLVDLVDARRALAAAITDGRQAARQQSGQRRACPRGPDVPLGEPLVTSTGWRATPPPRSGRPDSRLGPRPCGVAELARLSALRCDRPYTRPGGTLDMGGPRVERASIVVDQFARNLSGPCFSWRTHPQTAPFGQQFPARPLQKTGVAQATCSRPPGFRASSATLTAGRETWRSLPDVSPSPLAASRCPDCRCPCDRQHAHPPAQSPPEGHTDRLATAAGSTPRCATARPRLCRRDCGRHGPVARPQCLVLSRDSWLPPCLGGSHEVFAPPPEPGASMRRPDTAAARPAPPAQSRRGGGRRDLRQGGMEPPHRGSSTQEFTHMLRRTSRNAITALAGMLALLGVLAVTAQAATFNQYLGTLPNGTPTPAGPWNNLTYGGTGGGSFGVSMPFDAGGGWISTASLGPAANLPWSHAEATRSYSLPVSWAVYQPQASTSWETVGWLGGAYSGASASGTVGVSNPSSLAITVGCYTGGGGSDPNPRCAAGGNWIASQIRLTVRDEDFPSAALVNAGGEMLNGQWKTSTAIPLEVTASDVGGGAYRAYVSDGTTTIYSRLDPSNPRCADATVGSGTQYDFTASSSSLVPCKTASQTYTPEFDLTQLGDGIHSGLTFGVEDVAGNKTIVASNRTVKLNMAGGSIPDEGTPCAGGTYAADGSCVPDATGTTPTPPLGGGGGGGGFGGGGGAGPTTDKTTKPAPEAPTDPTPTNPGTPTPTVPTITVKPINGQNATSAAALCVVRNAKGCKLKSDKTITVNYGQKLGLSGRVLNSAGQPIVGAAVEIVSTSIGGARAAATTTVRTDANGVYKYVVPAGPSRTISFGYRYRQGDTEFAGSRQVMVAVQAKLSLTPNSRTLRNGQSVVFRGKVYGASSGSKALVEVQAQIGKNRWVTVRGGTAKIGKGGKYRASYRFERTTRTSIYKFRARVLPVSGWPYDPGYSATRKVIVRP